MSYKSMGHIWVKDQSGMLRNRIAVDVEGCSQDQAEAKAKESLRNSGFDPQMGMLVLGKSIQCMLFHTSYGELKKCKRRGRVDR